jgi:hypothetical protein
VSPTSINFGQVYLYSAMQEETVTVKNIGTSPLNISGVSLTLGPGTNSGDFTIGNGCSSRLTAGSSCTIKTFSHPDQVGTLTATLNIADNAAGSPQQVKLKMTVINPRASISPYSLNFGTVEVGHSSTQKVTVTNTGTTALDISKVGVTGADAGNFKPTNLCPSSLAPSDSCTIEVTFTPSTTGSRSATLTVTDNAKTSPQSDPLSGKGSN